jgi:predicted enzyme involved in methoxymalonyl-ACP biosynthesis
MTLKDAYGDYGIIAAALVVDDTIDSFLLSCRAFGKRAENAFLVHVLDFMKRRGCKEAFGRYIASPRNSMTKDFYQGLGFVLEKQTGDDYLWRFDFVHPIPKVPRWITIQSDAPLISPPQGDFKTVVPPAGEP